MAMMLAASAFPAAPLIAQREAAATPVSRSTAIASATKRGPRAALASADRSIASANVLSARQWENPLLAASYSKDVPQQHYSLDIALDLWSRSPRIAAAERSLDAARFRYTFALRAIAFDADTAYTSAQLTRAHSRLSTRTARDADSLLVLARLRRDAGDASELDVELAAVFAGQARNAASADSLSARAALLTVQTLMGLPTDSATIVVTDSLRLEEPVPVPPDASAAAPVTSVASPLLTGAAALDVNAAESRLRTEQRRVYGAPSLMVGFETANQGGPGGALPTVGIALPIPLFNRNGAGVGAARADVARAQAQFTLVQLEAASAVLTARREADAARLRAQRSAALVASADRISTLSLLAYREGASTLLVVLEAQRAARETLGQYFDDVAASRTATSRLELLTTPAPGSRTP